MRHTLAAPYYRNLLTNLRLFVVCRCRILGSSRGWKNGESSPADIGHVHSLVHGTPPTAVPEGLARAGTSSNDLNSFRADPSAQRRSMEPERFPLRRAHGDWIFYLESPGLFDQLLSHWPFGSDGDFRMAGIITSSEKR